MADIRIHGPDGSSFSFPEGTTEDIIGQAMTAHYGGGGQSAAPSPSPTSAGGERSGDSFVDGVVRSAGRGVLGIGSYLDEMNAATNATLAPLVDPLLPDSFEKLPGATWSERYDQALGIQRGRDKSFDEAHPVVSTVGQVAGGIGSAGAALAVAPVAASRALGMGAQTVRGQVAAAGGSGLGIGAVQGFGAGEGGVSERGREAIYNGVAGGGLGIVALPVGAAVGKGAGAIANRFASSGGQFGRGSQDIVGRTLADEGLTIEDAGRLAREMGPSAMLADATEGLRYRAEQIAQSDNPARSGVITSLRDRSASAGGRINTAYDAALGPRPNVQQALAAMTKQRKDSADLLYGQARTENAPVDVAPVISAIDGQLLTPAERIAGPSGLPADEVDTALAWVRSHLTDGASQRTGIDRLDRLERRLRARTTAAFKGGKSDVGNALNEVGRTLREQMKASSPVYAQARATFSDDSAVQDAFTSGRKLFGSETHPDFLAAEVADMSEAERDALRLGVRAAVDESMGRVRNGSLKGRQLLDSDFNERKILTVLGEDEGRALINSLQGEQAMAETASQAIGNSATSRRMDNPFRVQQRTQQDRAVPGIIRSAGNLNFGDAAFRGLEYAQDALGRRSAANMASELGPALTATGDARERIVEELMRLEGQRQSATSMNPKYRAIADALTRGGALALAPNVRP